MAEEYQKYAAYALDSKASGEFSLLPESQVEEIPPSEVEKKIKLRRDARQEVTKIFCNFFRATSSKDRPEFELMNFKNNQEFLLSRGWRKFVSRCQKFNEGTRYPDPAKGDYKRGPISIRIGERVVGLSLVYAADSDTFTYNFVDQKS